MDSYAFFILGSYAVTALVVAALVVHAVLDHRAQVQALSELEARGVRRRSALRTGPRAEEQAAS